MEYVLIPAGLAVALAVGYGDYFNATLDEAKTLLRGALSRTRVCTRENDTVAAYDKHLAQIEKNLQPGEEIVDSLSATVTTTPTSTSGTNSGALVATSKRLVWSGGFMFQSDLRSFPWQQISTIDYQTGMLLSHITVTGASALGRWLVAKVPKTQQFVDTANLLVHQAHAPAPAPTTVAAPSTADELAKLAQLRQQGVLTDEEFTAAKARLLS